MTSRRCARETCQAWAIRGGTVCVKHGGLVRKTRANAAVRAELSCWTLGDPVDDPGHTLLRLITQSRMRAETYAAELDRLMGDDPDKKLTDVLTRTSYGEGGQTGEYVRQIAVLEGQERDRCARFCKLAIDAGLAERMVRVAEKQGEMVAAAVRAAVGELELSEEMRRAVVAGVGRHVRLIAS